MLILDVLTQKTLPIYGKDCKGAMVKTKNPDKRGFGRVWTRPGSNRQFHLSRVSGYHYQHGPFALTRLHNLEQKRTLE